MKPARIFTALLLSIGISAIAMAQGGTVQRQTRLAVSEPTMVGNVLLDPGSYTLRVHDFQSEKVQVVVTRDSDSKTMGTVVASRERRSLDTHQASDNQVQFTYTTFNGHPAVATWFYPGDEWGEKFAYGAETTASVSTTGGDVTMTQTPAPTASTSTMAESTPPAPAPTESTVAEPAPAPAPAYSAPAPEPAPAMTTLPKTASSTPLVALLGALALAGASAVRFGRRKAA
jgi:LPXTG-motif cell wall-anchored protein